MRIERKEKHCIFWLMVACLSNYILCFTECTNLCLDTTIFSPYTQSGTRIGANVIYISEHSSFRDCIKQCLDRTDCKVLSYHKDGLVCELGRNANDVMTSPGFITVDMTNGTARSADIAGVCMNHTCPAGHVCVALSRGGHQCIHHNPGYTSDNRFVDIISGGTTDINATTFQECLSACQISNCLSFYYGHGQCKEYSGRLFSSHGEVVAGWRYYERTRTLGNIALGKPTTESSIEATTLEVDLSAASVVDGMRYPTTYAIGKTCFRSLGESNPWMSVDLLDVYFIQEVMILTKKGTKTSAFEDVTVLVRLTTEEYHCSSYAGVAPPETVINLVCDNSLQGRHVILRSYVSGKRFSVCELEVYGHL